MSVAFMKEGRPLFKANDVRGGTTEEKIATINGYVSYSGPNSVIDNKGTHHIEVSLFPNWVGEKQERTYEFKENQLTLSTPLMSVGGIMLSTHIIWEKVA